MARGKFGKIVPRFSEIVKIDGKNVIVADGDVFDRNLVVSMEKHGLKGYEVFPFDDFKETSDPTNKSENQ